VSGFQETVPAGLRTLPLAVMIATGSLAVERPALARPSGVPGRGEQLSCYAIRSGETAARLALRFTGSAGNRSQPWFQIVNPATGTFIPKSRYSVIQSGWHVCVATDRLRRGSTPPQDSLASSAPPALAPAAAIEETTPIDFSFLWWGAPVFVVVSGFVLAWARKGIDERRARLDIMKEFGDRFICEFDRPLCRSPAGPSIKSRLRFAPGRQRLEILLAPGDGRTYPNLVDHRKNMEYDVARVLRHLKDERFINDPLHAEGSWVVIPCRLYSDRQQEGGL
jgi:hypothetical protein